MQSGYQNLFSKNFISFNLPTIWGHSDLFGVAQLAMYQCEMHQCEMYQCLIVVRVDSLRMLKDYDLAMIRFISFRIDTLIH